eukprot:SAG11_NODE_1708_length_4407_cov_6.993036_5_plen_59_part_00
MVPMVEPTTEFNLETPAGLIEISGERVSQQADEPDTVYDLCSCERSMIHVSHDLFVNK